MSSRITIIGSGYVGLTTGACFAHLGHDVTCTDVDQMRVDLLNRGEVPILETGLENLLREGINGGRLSFVIGSVEAASASEFVYLCVPTPQGADGSADLSYIESAAAEIGPHLQPETIVVNKSTVPVGSTRVVELVLGRGDIPVVSNPEFLREGSAVHDFLHPDRIVIGADDRAAAVRVASLYLGIAAPLIVTDPPSAELIKYASNAFLATKVTFANAIAAVCEAVGADMNDVVLGMGYDKRIGQEFLRPGPGFGGSCFPKDTRALLRIAEDAGYDFDLLGGVVDVNEEQFERVANKAVELVGDSIDGCTVAVWGLTFKARTDDLRESPSLEIIKRLRERGANVKAFDPSVTLPLEGRRATDLDGIEVTVDPYAACAGAEVLLVLTEWDEFRWLDFDKVAEAMAHPRVVDGRNLLDRESLRRRGFAYKGIGRLG
ncbi:MAG TPA: UDP-glucose/GDP-mannose dehydrogenase family protein [Acidimicrobiales bacterium]|nr:UDP-glucose/GDP-mannose dehydrogenase family protein [Acidimicrobiales bacterium]